MKHRIHTNNSITYSEYVRVLAVENDEVLVSFEITSLYTNVPILDIHIIKDFLEKIMNIQQNHLYQQMNL